MTAISYDIQYLSKEDKRYLAKELGIPIDSRDNSLIYYYDLATYEAYPSTLECLLYDVERSIKELLAPLVEMGEIE